MNTNDWIRLNISFICYDEAGKDQLVLLYESTAPHATPYLIPEISNWIIKNDIEIELHIDNYKYDKILSDYVAIKFKNPEDKVYFIIRFIK